MGLVESKSSRGRESDLKKLIFVCSGNTCRSPLAEVIAKKIFPDRLSKQVRISSAGSSTVDGLPASALAVEVAREHGLDLGSHRSRRLTAEMVRDADLIVTMTEAQRRSVVDLVPEALDYTYRIDQFSGKEGEVPDPIGGGKEAYERTFELLSRYLRALADKLEGFDGWKRVSGTKGE
jgi:protein-tyrosine-phosphatase